MHSNFYGSFLALTFKDKIYRDYVNVKQEVRDLEVQNLVISLREDGYFGFVGGTAEKGETEIETLARECKEEANIDIFALERLTKVSEYALPDGFVVKLFHAEISKEEALNVILQSAFSEHFLTETAGLVSIACRKNSAFMKNAFLPLMGKQFVDLGILLDDEVLKSWGCEQWKS